MGVLCLKSKTPGAQVDLGEHNQFGPPWAQRVRGAAGDATIEMGHERWHRA